MRIREGIAYGIAAAGLAGTAVLALENRALERGRDADRAELVKQSGRAGKLERQLAASGEAARRVEARCAEIERARRQLVEAPRGAEAPAPASAEKARAVHPMVQQAHAKLSVPEIRKRKLEKLKRKLGAAYGELFRAWGLDAQAQDAALEALAARGLDLRLAAVKVLDGTVPEEEILREEEGARGRAEAGLRRLLSDDQIARLVEADRQREDLRLARDIQRRATRLGLDPTRSEAFQSVLLEENARARADIPFDWSLLGGSASSGIRLDAGQIRGARQVLSGGDAREAFLRTIQETHDRILSRTRGFLTAEQLDTLARAQASRLEAIRIHLEKMDAMSGSGS